MRIIITGVVCLLASSLSASNLFDTVQSLREQAWESEYIPESSVPTVPLTEYDEFEVVELFRAETIEELEASLTDGYPYAWLEETLKDESIPWEDRYWLDRRVRAAISQNLHVFFDTENNPIHIEADVIFPGEYYWREHMIADLIGLNVPEGVERPEGFELTDIGHLLDPYGYREGEFAFAIPSMSVSRDASIGVVAGLVSLHPEETFPVETFEFIMFPDGSYKQEFGLDSEREYDAIVSPDGSMAVFCCLGASPEDIAEENADTHIYDRNGNLLRSFTLPIRLSHSWLPAISENGQYLCHAAREADACLIDCNLGTAEIVSERTEYYRNCCEYSFSPDGEYLCLGGSTTGRMLSINTDETIFYSETNPIVQSAEHPFTTVMSSNSGNCVTVTTRRGERSDYSRELLVNIDGCTIFSELITPEDGGGFTQTDVSPNGYFLILNPVAASHGAPDYRSQVENISSYSRSYNLPYVLMQIKGR